MMRLGLIILWPFYELLAVNFRKNHLTYGRSKDFLKQRLYLVEMGMYRNVEVQHTRNTPREGARFYEIVILSSEADEHVCFGTLLKNALHIRIFLWQFGEQSAIL